MRELIEELRSERDRALRERDALREELEELRARGSDEERLKRLAADLANVRRHQDETIRLKVRLETDRLLLAMAELRDAMDAALRSGDDDDNPWRRGVVALRDKVDAALRREGLSIVGAPGEPFDPKLHEALTVVPGEGGEERVMDVVEVGLVRADASVLRPARVVVTRGD